MSKKILSALLSTAMVATLLVGCGGTAQEAAPAADSTTTEAATEEAAPAAEANGIKIGVSMPTKDLQRWNQDGDNMKKELEAAGYEVDLQYAANDVQQQVSQCENMISSGCNVLVIAAVEGYQWVRLFQWLRKTTFL